MSTLACLLTGYAFLCFLGFAAVWSSPPATYEDEVEKVKAKKIYQAVDGKQFENADHCRDHEDGILLKRLEGLDGPTILAAIGGKNVEVRAALIFAHSLIQAHRESNGEVKKRKPKGGPWLPDQFKAEAI
jgi:hypothetical protein